MLVSPLMGPILATTFGFVVKDYPLLRLGVRNELLALFICILVGMIVGACYTPFATDFEWPNTEMESLDK